MKKIIFLLIMYLVLGVLSGCGDKGSKSNRNLEAPPIISHSESDSIDVDMYLDGTFSMAGYVNFSSGTIYSESIKNIERTITTSWKEDKIQYIKFGDKLKTLNRDQFLSFNHVNFYKETDTSLQKVIEQMDTSKFNILVTDLFQTNQDIDSLGISLKQKCFNDESKALVLIGIKSQFNGRIYDIGKRLASFNYKSNEEVASYRPFYILAIGKEADVRKFARDFAKKYNDKEILKVALYSKNLGTNIELLAGKPIRNEKDTEKISNMAQISTLLGSGSDILQLRLKLDDKCSGFNGVLLAKDVFENCPEKVERFTCTVEKWEQESRYDSKNENSLFDKVLDKGNKRQSKYFFKEVQDKEFISLIGNDLGIVNGNANLNLKFKFDPIGIKKQEGKYRIKVAVYPSQKNYIESNKIFSSWNCTDEVVNDLNNLQSVGGKTLNINAFVDMVSSLNYVMNKPGFYNIYVYLEAIK